MNSLFTGLYQPCDIFADRVCQNKLAAQTVTLVELTTESGKFSHYFNEVALRLSILVLYSLLLLSFLSELLLEGEVFVESVSQLDFIFLDDPTADLFVYGLPSWTQIIIDKLHGRCALDQSPCWRATHSRAILAVKHV